MSTHPRSSSAARAGVRSSPLGRRVGYAVAILVNVVMFLLVNVWPTWRAVPFLTEATQDVIALVNLSLIAGVVVNVLNLVLDLAWVRTVGDLVTSVIALIATIRIWDVFPFAFGDTAFDWELLTRVVLGIAIGGTIISIIVQVVILIRMVLGFGPAAKSDDRPA
ncbi:hypothetical protein [Agromyces bauzanensis]